MIPIGPEGVSETIVTHEPIHAELHRSMRLPDVWDQWIPAWFDEELASHLSGDFRLDMAGNAR